MNKSKKGISLIVLVVTIVVIIILMVTVLYNITDGKLFGVANESVFKNDLRVIEEEFEMFVQTKATQSVGKFEIESLNAADEGLMYNTKTDDRETNIYDVIPTAKRGYYGEFEIIKGELYYKGKEERKLIWAKELGIGIIPYEIVDGVLISANSNLLLLDSTGTVRIPYNVTKIGEGVFNNLEGLTRVIIPGSVKEIGKNAFSNNTSLQEVIMEEGVETISNQAFYNCTNLTNVQIPNTVTYIGTGAFRLTKNLVNINLPNSVAYIGDQGFFRSGIKKIKLPSSLKTINFQLFTSCLSLEEIIIPSSITEITNSAFSNCIKLNNIDTSQNDNFVFENNCLYTKDYKTLIAVTGDVNSISINELTENILSSAMYGMGNIKDIYIPASVKSIGKNSALGTHKLDKLVVDERNLHYASYDNDLYDKNLKTLIKCNKDGEVVVKEGVIEIISGAFLSKGVNSITLPESLEKISGGSTFPSGISYIYIPKNVNDIDNAALLNVDEFEISEENTKYKSIDNKYLVSKDEKTLYFAANSITNTNDLPETIEIIDKRAFYQHTGLVEVKLNAPIKEIRDNAFDYCPSLRKVEIANTIESIAVNAFSKTGNLTEVIIHKKRGEIKGEPWGISSGTRVITYDE